MPALGQEQGRYLPCRNGAHDGCAGAGEGGHQGRAFKTEEEEYVEV